ncbi:uncharacterized protein LOC112085998 [Eutrema salsugineum]|uniref:uncharacterized protein LOC112085998 n=1 Tax=Eutrema salsugineum TaxID=72664 RepID=UPI000CED10EE|nr:uncharacterized protein LOC112085998 [Eutrema salsugineum]
MALPACPRHVTLQTPVEQTTPASGDHAMAPLLHSLLDRMDEMTRQTDRRFAELTAGRKAHTNQPENPRSLVERDLEEAHRSKVILLQRNLFGDSPTESAGPSRRSAQLANRSAKMRPQHSSPGAFRQMAAERDRDAEIEAIKAKICEMNSKVHRATISAPEIDRVLQETQNTPFTHRIASTPFRHVSKVKFPPYAGDTDLTQYLTTFTIAMGRAHFTPEEREAGHCQLFVENLVSLALTWFSRLETHSIDSFNVLSTAFLKHYSIFIQRSASTADLWTLNQGPKESLRSFIERFKATASRASISNESAIPALRKALHFDSVFKDELKLNAPHTLEDALHRARLHIEVEEERASLRKLASQKNPPQKEKAQDEYHESRQHYDEEYQRRQVATFLISDAPTSCLVEEAPAVFHVDNRPGMVVPNSSQQYYQQPLPSNK